MEETKPSISKEQAVAMLWNRGELRWKLHSTQLDMYNEIKNNPEDLVVIACSRRLGKTYLMCIMAIEQCLKKPHSIVKFIAPKQKQIRQIIKPIMQDIAKDCPLEMKPDYKTAESVFVFKNGSEIQLAGTDNENHENLRGSKGDLCIVDEAGFCSDLNYVISSILLPTTDTTGGKVIIASTPSKTPDHEFILDFMLPALDKGTLIRKTIYDNPKLDQRDLQRIIDRYREKGGENSSEFRREYLTEIIIDEDSAVIPEFTAEVERKIVKEWEKPPFYDSYVAMDVGFRDLTVVLFAYYDFRNAKIVIEDEIVMNGPTMTINYLAAQIISKEQALWKNPYTGAPVSPYMRVSDTDLITINELYKTHNVIFFPTKKDNKEAALNDMRMKIQKGDIIISPKCKTLIKHLRGGIWNKNRTSYQRTADLAHADAIDACAYLIRNIQYTKNPYPKNYGYETGEWFMPKQLESQSNMHKEVAKMFRIKINK